MRRDVDTRLITEVISEMAIQANHYLSPDMDKAMKDAVDKESSELGK